MTITDSIDRPTHVSHPTITTLIAAMPPHLQNYAGASYRDESDWRVCLAWIQDPTRTESECKAAALKGTPFELTAAQIRAANPGMR